MVTSVTQLCLSSVLLLLHALKHTQDQGTEEPRGNGGKGSTASFQFCSRQATLVVDPVDSTDAELVQARACIAAACDRVKLSNACP